MAITFGNSTPGTDTSNDDTCTVSHVLQSDDNYVLACVGYEYNDETTNPNDITGVTYNGVAMTFVPSSLSTIAVSNNKNETGFWYMLAADLPAAGTYDCVASWTANTGDSGLRRTMEVIGIKGASQEAPEAVATNTGTSSTSITQSITTLTDNAVIIDCCSVSGSTTMTPDAGQTDLTGGGIVAGSTTTTVVSHETKVTAGAETQGQTAGASQSRLAYSLIALVELATGANPKGPLGNPLYGPLGGPI